MTRLKNISSINLPKNIVLIMYVRNSGISPKFEFHTIYKIKLFNKWICNI